MRDQLSRLRIIVLPILLLVTFRLQTEFVSAQILQAELVTRQQSNSLAYERYLVIKQVDSTGTVRLIDSTEILTFIVDYEFSLQGQYLYVYSAFTGEYFSPSITKSKIEGNKITLIKRLELDKLDQRNGQCNFYTPGFATLDCNTKRVLIDLSDLTISAVIPYKTE